MANPKSKRLDAKTKMLLAALEIIKDKGMRALTHRAVAELAKVSLGATTYHFKSIADLISEAFLYWHQEKDLAKNPYFVTIQEDVLALTNHSESAPDLARKVYLDGEKYLKNQVFEHEGDRKIELAFHNEALRNEKLSSLLLGSWDNEVQRLANLFRLLKTSDPNADAEITFALILQLEKKLLLMKSVSGREAEFEKCRLILKRHIDMVTQIQN